MKNYNNQKIHSKWPKSTLILLKLVLLATKAHTKHSYNNIKYWTLNSPSIKAFYPHRGSFDSSVIKYTRSIDAYPWSRPRDWKAGDPIPGSPIIHLKISNARSSLLDQLQVVEASCDTSTASSTQNSQTAENRGSLGKMQYTCFAGTVSTQSAFTSTSSTYSMQELYLELPSGVNFTSYESLSHGFLLKSSKNQKYASLVFDYSTPFRELYEDRYTFKYNEFPYGVVYLLLASQILVLGFLALVSDKSRLPLFSLFLMSVGYLPLHSIVKRGTLASPDSGFRSLYAFYLVSLIIIILAIFARKSRKTQKMWWIGILLALTTTSLLISTTYLSIQRFQLVLPIAPITLILEQSQRTKHRYLAIVALTLLLSQAALYYLVLNSTSALESAFFNIERVHCYFPTEIYCVLAFATLVVCLSGPQIAHGGKGTDGEIREEEVPERLVERGSVEAVSVVQAVEGYEAAPSLDNSFVAFGDGYGVEGGEGLDGGGKEVVIGVKEQSVGWGGKGRPLEGWNVVIKADQGDGDGFEAF